MQGKLSSIPMVDSGNLLVIAGSELLIEAENQGAEGRPKTDTHLRAHETDRKNVRHLRIEKKKMK